MPLRKPLHVKSTPEVEDYFNSLPAGHKHRKWILEMKTVLSENMLAGDKIEKDRFPREYVRKYQLHNLYKYDHPEDYRSPYTLLSEKEEKGAVSVFVLGFLNHHEYNKLFGYFK